MFNELEPWHLLVIVGALVVLVGARANPVRTAPTSASIETRPSPPLAAI